jgi:hypothetical protein
MKAANPETKAAGPRLRFDRVAIGLVERVRSAVAEFAPIGAIVLFAVTAPIRLPAKTAAAIETKIRHLFGSRRAARIEDKSTMHGNGIFISIDKTGSRSAPVVLGFVHNPETDAGQLFKTTRNELAMRRTAKV